MRPMMSLKMMGFLSVAAKSHHFRAWSLIDFLLCPHGTLRSIVKLTSGRRQLIQRQFHRNSATTIILFPV